MKGKTKLKICKNLSIYYDEMNIRRQNGKFQFEEDLFSRNVVEGIGKIYDKVLFFMKLLQTKPENKKMNINCYDSYYTVIKNRDEKEIVDNQYENDENDKFNDIIPNHNITIKPRETIIK